MDIGRALTYFSDDDRWVEKTAIGTGLILISSLLLVALVGFLGYFILFGYLVRLIQNVRDEAHPVLPEWDQWGDDLVRGVKLAGVYLVWALPIILVSVPLFIIGVVISDNMPYGDDNIGALFGICALCLQFLFGIAYAVFQPGFTVAYARNENISDGLQVSEIWDWTRDNIGNVVIVAILTVIASLIIMTVGSIVGLILCIIGTVVTVPLSQLITYYFQGHLYGQLARIAGEGAKSGSFGAVPAASAEDSTWVEADSATDPAPPAEVVPPEIFEPQEEPEPPIEPEPPVEPELPVEPEPPVEPEIPVEPESPARSEGFERSEADEPPEEPKSQ